MPHEAHIAVECKELEIGYQSDFYNTKSIQRQLNLQLKKGDFVCLIGPNGCGKSTLLRTLAGLQKAITGDIFLGNQKLEIISQLQRTRMMSVVLTEKTIVDNISVSEIVTLGRYAFTNWFGKVEASDEEIIRESIHAVGLQSLSHRFFGTLSDGEKQRVLIAKALASEAPLMLLDEPTAHLDIPNRVEMMGLLRSLTRCKGQTIMVSTHDLDLALQLADEIWLMHPEKPMICGTPEEIAFSGKIDEFFDNKSFAFVPHSGTFSVNIPETGSISVIGSGSRYDELLKALNRIGIKTNAAVNEDLKIEVVTNGFELFVKENRQTFSNLYSLLKQVRRLSETVTTD